MEFYLLKSTAILAIFWILYMVFLERESIHRFKRFYLLTSLVAAICIPLISIPEYVYVQPLDGNLFINEAIPFVALEPLKIIEAPFWNLERILWAIYSIGVSVFAFRFFKNLTQIFKTINTNEKQKAASITFVLLRQLINPHTFFNYIFLNKSKFENNALPKEVILHEETHAKQKHSLDVLFIELLQIVFWFQPFIWLYKTRIKLNHEFLADQAVIKNGFEPVNYQNTLLSYSSNDEDFILANAINYSSIKKRFTVMKTQTSKSKIWLLSLLTLTILGVLAYSFSAREVIEIEEGYQDRLSAQVSNENSVLNKKTEASQILMNEYKDFIKKFKETNTIYGDAYERAIVIYDKLMSDSQRESVEKYPDRIIPMPNLSKIKPRKPTSTQFEAFKNTKEYAVWIDNKHVSNSELNNYKVEDFVHVSGSRVFKNARSKKFPQPNQYHLYTEAGFKSTYKDSQLKRYKKATDKYSNAISNYLKGDQIDNSELIILKSKADAIYKTFSPEELKINNIKTTPPVPAVKVSHSARSISIKVLGNENYEVDGVKTNKASFVSTVNKLHQDISSEIRNRIINIHVSFTDKESNDEVWFIYNSLLDYGFHRLVTKNQEVIKSKGNKPFLSNRNTTSRQHKPPTAKEIAEYNTWAKKVNSKSKKLSKDATWYPPIEEENLVKSLNIYKRMTKQQKENAEEMLFPGMEIKEGQTRVSVTPQSAKQQKTPTKKEVEEYNAWASALNQKIKKAEQNKDKFDYPIIKLKDINQYKSIYNRLSSKQKINAEAFPNIPPLPPPPTKVKQYKKGKKKTLEYIIKNTRKGAKSGYEVLENGESHYYIIYKGKKTYYNKDGYITDNKGNILPPPPAPKSPKTIKTDFDVPPPPPPPVPKEAKGKLGKHHVKAYNDWINFIKGDNPDPKYMTVEIYEYYRDMYEAFTEAQKKQTEGIPPPPPPPAPKKSKSKGGPNTNQQAMINYLKKIDGPDVIFTQIDAKPNKIPHYNTHLSLNEATSLIEKDSRMRLYPYNSPHSGFIVLISNNVENTIPKLTKNNRIEYIRAISSIGAKFYLDNKEIDFKKAKRILKKNPQATMASTITPPVVNIRTSLIGIKGTSIDVKSGPNPDSYNDVSTDSFVNIESYLKKYKHYEVLRNQKPHYINKSKSQQKEMDALFSDLGGMYFRLSKENKKLVERPIAPIRPYVKITLGGKTYYKKFKELTKEEKETLPPPPPPIMKKNK
ncbi:M56 family metallopeptidase [Winogradskyella sp. PC-19]|uniref:M56 family metallopeptidase n=1 Tax=Winogradskyella sp. PC-19 TaxID=754417 RepID=UPI0012FAA873|nr:M56 family metallopeptidase [Winogradskyella sp. PC-19]